MDVYRGRARVIRRVSHALVFGLCIFLAPIAYAQEASSDLIEYLDEVYKDEGLSPAQKATEIIRALEIFARQQEVLPSRSEWTSSANQQAPESASAFDAPVLSRFSGRDGIPFPSKEQSVRKPSEESAPLSVEMPTPVPGPTAKPYQRPSRCEKNETKRAVYGSDESENILLFDYLYIPESLVPSDPEEVFGKDTRVVSVPAQPDKGTDLRLEIHDVPCLPYRNRKTNKAEYEDRGLNALRNYDGGQATPGKLHPIMQGKYR